MIGRFKRNVAPNADTQSSAPAMKPRRSRRHFPPRRQNHAIRSTNCSNPMVHRRRSRVQAAGGVEAGPHEALMTNEELLRERVAKLEVQMTHLNEKLDDTHQKVEEMHAILLQAKGARW
jgi:hypothetical protein